MRLRVFAIGPGPGPRNVGLENEHGERLVTSYGQYLRHYKRQVEDDRDWWKRRAEGPERRGVSFFDNYKDIGGGGQFVSADEKQALIENGVAFEITGLTWDPENKHGARYVSFCNIPNLESGDVEERKIGFPFGSGADSRDAMLKAMDEYFQNGGEPVKVKLDQPGRAIFITPAE